MSWGCLWLVLRAREDLVVLLLQLLDLGSACTAGLAGHANGTRCNCQVVSYELTAGSIPLDHIAEVPALSHTHTVPQSR